MFSKRKFSSHLSGARAGDVRGRMQEEGAGPRPAAPAAAAPWRPRPPPGRPLPTVAQFTAEPTSIQRGQSSTLRWEVTGNVTSVSIDRASERCRAPATAASIPSDSTTYTLTATGPGGTATASATVNVSAPPPPPPPPAAAADGHDRAAPGVRRPGRLLRLRQDRYPQRRPRRSHPECRGAQGDPGRLPECVHRDRGPLRRTRLRRVQPRAGRPPRQLRQGVPAGQLGVPADRLKTISYGKERPQCTEQNETCWQKNRRVHFVAGQ